MAGDLDDSNNTVELRTPFPISPALNNPLSAPDEPTMVSHNNEREIVTQQIRYTILSLLKSLQMIPLVP
jgi:hypothetical protein